MSNAFRRESPCGFRAYARADLRIDAPRMTMTDRAGRWVTERVGRFARRFAEVTRELGCDWRIVNNAS